VLAVLSGEISAQVGKGRARMKQWETVLVPAGEELTLRNASPEPTVLLLVAAPPPAPSSD
jgi:mannose-6-phosphate isomerase-like protein (cupin superfamily)